MPLTVQKLGLSRYRPWRIVLTRGEATPQGIEVFTTWAPPGTTPLVLPGTGCVTAQEAQALLAQLEPVGDWDAYATWTRAQQQAALAILAASPSEQAKDARLRRGYWWQPWRTLDAAHRA